MSSNQNDDEELLTRTQVAAMAGVGERTIARLEQKGKGPPSRKYGHSCIRYPASGVRAWLEEVRT
jgi:predicted DNA-binding transcriptional regulator AlpA